MNRLKNILAWCLMFLLPVSGFSQMHTIAGEARASYPTLINIGLEWMIQGDDNLNSVVQVTFRKKGTTNWLRAMDLRRVPAGENPTAKRLERKINGYTGFKWANKHAGSIFDLDPGTLYEIKLSLQDRDGGSTEKLLQVRTRPDPRHFRHAKIISIQPGNYDTLHTTSGTEEEPVVYRCATGKAIFKHVDVRNKKWVSIENIRVVNLAAGGIGMCFNGAENCVARFCTINAVYGIVAYLPGATNCYFADNTIEGTCVWRNESMGAQGDNIGEGIEITGSGNVICYNSVKGFRDCISFMEDEHLVEQSCNDIYNNDISIALDDAIEADFSFSNCRVFRNRITNCYVGLSSQPGLGGPTYFIRNVMYNVVHAAFKLKRFSRGDVVLHNTVIKIGAGLGGNDTMDHAYFRNNLAIGGPNGGINWGGYGAGEPFAANIITPGDRSSFDYDAIGVYGTEYKALIGNKPFYEAEPHGVEHVDLEKTFFAVPFPYPPIPAYAIPDLSIKPGSAVVDKGIFLPNINDHLKGKAPDCGAYEAGQTLPHYGPRVKQ